MKRKRRSVHLDHLSVRMPVTVVAATDGASEGFHSVVTTEGVWSRDGRMIETGGLRVSEGPNAQVLMGLLENTQFHERAVNIGHFTRWQNRGGEWHGWGQWANTDEAWDIREAVRGSHVTSVSVELADVEVQYLIPKAMLDDMEAIDDEYDEDASNDDNEPETETIDGEEYLVVDIPQERYRILTGEITGASVVPTGAFGDGTIEDLMPDEQRPTGEAIAASAAPARPPREWFTAPTERARELGHTFDVEIDDDGRVFGYPAASWDTIHATRDVTPPRSTTNYANFARRRLTCADGSKVRVGPLTLRGGHADERWSASRAMAHYDDTDSAFADVAIGEDEFGMWVAGALRPNVTPEAIRVASCSGFSGDWRMIGTDYDLIAISAVNAEAFRNRVRVYEDDMAMVASMTVDMPSLAVVQQDALLASAAERIAKSIGRDTESRLRALDERVHPRG